MTRLAIVAVLAVSLAARADTAHDVARVRGLAIKKPIELEILDRDELRARLAKAVASRRTQDDLHREGVALERWGFVPPGSDVAQVNVDILAEQIAGTYDPETKKLMLVSPIEEFVLIHESEHALQDQHFDLAKVEGGDGDEALARHAFVEGDALVTMLEVILDRKGIAPPWNNPTIVADLARALDVPVGDTLDQAPLAIRETKLFPYKAGFAFVAALRALQPWSAIDAVFKKPPRSTEQILHPDRYLADDQPVAVTAPTLADATVIYSTTWGELGFQLWLRAHGLDTDVAKLAAAGWGGDRVTTVDQAGHTIGLARFTWDSEADAIEAYEAATRAIDDSQLAARAEHTETRTVWLALDGTVSIVERRDIDLTIVVGLPLTSVAALK